MDFFSILGNCFARPSADRRDLTCQVSSADNKNKEKTSQLQFCGQMIILFQQGHDKQGKVLKKWPHLDSIYVLIIAFKTLYSVMVAACAIENMPLFGLCCR